MSSARSIAALTIACACAACEREPTQEQEKRSGLDPCGLVTQSDASAIFGRPAVRMQSGEGECAWGYDDPDHSTWSLHLKVSDIASLHGPVIIVTKSEITYKGQPIDTGPTISQDIALGRNVGVVDANDFDGIDVHWKHGNKYTVQLKMTSIGPSAPRPTTKIEPMKQLARRVEAALGG